MNTPDVVCDSAAVLGEGPVWDCRRQSLWWVDIEQGHIHETDPVTGTDTVRVRLPKVSCVSPTRSGHLFACAGYRYGVVNTDCFDFSVMGSLGDAVPNTRFNDGKCDPRGTFWAGTMSLDTKTPHASLYRFTGSGFESKVNNVTVSNGIAWSLDGLSMYYIDTPKWCVDSFQLSDEGRDISNGRTVISVSRQYGRPDGMTIDADGMLWIAHWDGNAISRWNPTNGALLERFDVPAHRVTSCMFGGFRMDTLFVTTAKFDEHSPALKHSGALFALYTGNLESGGTRGLPEPEMVV